MYMSSWCLIKAVLLCLGIETGHGGPEIQLMLINRTPSEREEQYRVTLDITQSAVLLLCLLKKKFCKACYGNFNLCWWTILTTEGLLRRRGCSLSV